jgi:hypothetical protein
MMGEMPEELKNSIIIPVYKTGEKQKVESYREISLFNACYKLHTKILNEKFKAQTEQFPFLCARLESEMEFMVYRSIVWREIPSRKTKRAEYGNPLSIY